MITYKQKEAAACGTCSPETGRSPMTRRMRSGRTSGGQFGKGKRALPDNLSMRLELLGERRFRSGGVQLHYRVIV